MRRASFMGGWVSPQPLPRQLEDLLQQAGIVRRLWCERQLGDMLIILAPHWLLHSGSLSWEDISSSYHMILDVIDGVNGSSYWLLNGERLLAFTPVELANWDGRYSLPRPANLAPLPLLEAAFTSVLVAHDPDLVQIYQKLDMLSDRGGDHSHDDYLGRLAKIDIHAAVGLWNRQLSNEETSLNLNLARLQLVDADVECLRQFRIARELANHLATEVDARRWEKQRLRQLSTLIQKLLQLIARIA
jgi:hypothetical protein